ncbi:alkaline phosphatase-like [Mytilus trossulus]|uniref:alkaline phosphatase-like n=1 Tax=Mytilus trossulus TaxID=6551 RepID=UPI003003EF12
MVSLLVFLLLSIVHAGTEDWHKIARDLLTQQLKIQTNTNKAKNIILFIGDGMGMPTITSARIYKGQQMKKTGEETVFKFEEFPNVALSKTYGSDRQIPDSSQTATALMCGEKANFYTIGVNDKVSQGDCASEIPSNKLTSILDHFIADGRAGGFVTTARLTHATPGSSYAHTANRAWESNEKMKDVPEKCKDIAYQFVYDNTKIQVAMGGGRRHFLPNTTKDPEYNNKYGRRVDGQDLIAEWQKKQGAKGRNHRYVWNKGEFDSVDPQTTDYLLGLFEYSHMQYEVDRDTSSVGEPSITEMVEKAIRILKKNSNGFFLLVEGSNIDIAHHDSLAAKALTETVSLDKAVTKALELTNEEDTLVIVTADHSHVFSMGGYNYRGNDILGLANPIDYEPPLDGMPYTTLNYANGPGVNFTSGKRPNLTNVDTTSFDYIPQAAVPVEYETHGGEDVPIFSKGPMSHLLNGVKEQHYVAHVMQYAACVGDFKDDSHCKNTEPKPTCSACSITWDQVTLFLSLIGIYLRQFCFV